jgi:UDP-N-acetylmuramoyl-tripeptide--D-alanyl-D-alanine ligase
MILGDMLELGKVSSDEHQNIIDKAKKLNIKTFFIGKEFGKASNKYDFTYFNNSDELIIYLKENKLPSSSILIKGSRGIKLEKAAEHLQQ